MADLKDFGVVKSWYSAYKQVLGEADEKKKEDEKKPAVEVLPKEDDKEEEKKPEEKSEGGEVEKLKAEIEKLKGELQAKDLEVKKKDAETTVEPNPETGEVPLRVGIAQSIIDKQKEKEKKGEKKEVKEMAKDKAYAIGMDTAKKKYNDEPPLDKKTITKGHEIAKKLLKKESLDEKIEYVEYKFRNKRDAEQAKKMVDGINTMDLDVNDDAIGMGELTVDAGKKDFTRFHNMIVRKYRPKIMAKESLDESKVVDYAKKLSSYAVKKGGIDRKDFMKIADRISTAKNDMDMKKIGKLVDDMDTEPRDLIKGSIALQMGPKTYKTMFGDRLTASDMNQYKKMTPRDMREESLDEVNADAKGTVPSKQIASLKKAYNSLPDRIDPEKAMALSKMLNRFGEGELRQLTHAGIKFISTLAINKLIMKYNYKAKDIHDIRKNKPKTVFD